MELNFFQDFRQSLEKLTCLRSPTNKSLDLQNFSIISDNIETLHSRTNSCAQDDALLSQTMPIPTLSLLTEELDQDQSAYKQITSSIRSNNTSLFRKFMNLNTNLHFINKKKRNYLHLSAKYGSLEICQLILAYSDLNVNSRDSQNKSPLHFAAINGHINVVKFLHRCGGYLHIKDKQGKTIIDYSIESKNLDLIKFVFEKSPSLFKSFGFNINELLKLQGISLDMPHAIGNDSKSKVKKVEDQQDPVTFSDFLLIQELGRGSFGTVYLVKHINSGKLFAMKLMTKEKIYKENLEEYISTEKGIMASIDSDFIVKLYYAFQTPQYFCLVIDYCPGGTLAQVLQRETRLSEAKAKKYLSEILLALECLHSKNIIYRDLKPENVLIDEHGHIKITDFGLAKTGIFTESAAASFCGTVSYLAPEIIAKKGYGKAADWYAFGILMFEMLTGAVPFKNASKICDPNSTPKLKIPSYVSVISRNLIEGLLCVDYKFRLGFKCTDQVKLHNFFADVNWEAVQAKSTKMDLPVLKSVPGCYLPESALPNCCEMQDLKNWSFIDLEN